MSFGSSPISPDSCAPTTLKYLKAIPCTFDSGAAIVSLKISSLIYFVLAYGFYAF